MEPQRRSGLVLFAVVLILIIGGLLAWYVSSTLFEEDAATPSATGPVPPQTIEKKQELYENLQTESQPQPEAVSTEERAQLLEEIQAEQSGEVQSAPTPSEAERARLLQGFE